MTTDNEHISPGSKLDLPFWLARVLCNKRNKKKHIADVEIPKQYKESYREILLADANVVDLHKLGPYYYTFGAQLLKFDPADASDIASSLVQTFQGRFRNIMDSSQNAYNEDNARLTAKLDEMEKDLFKAGQKGLNDFQDWETRRVEKLQTSTMVVNHKKRKRAALIE
ncbi:unnamed protein product [Owenia fusiformis]|nr:unnamed protein product [Owenia fusiformis]